MSSSSSGEAATSPVIRRTNLIAPSTSSSASPECAGNTAALGFDIPGTIVEGPDAKAVISKVSSIIGWRAPTFPGSQPVSLSCANLNLISRNNYVVCEKSDGIRFLLFAASGGIFLIDRKNVVRRLDMHLPRKDMPKESHQVTLLDGELVLDYDLEESSPSTASCNGSADIKDGAAFGGNWGDDSCTNTEGSRSNSDAVSSPGSCSSAAIRKVPKVRYLIYDGIAIQRDITLKEYNLLYRLSQVYVEVVVPYKEYYFNYSTNTNSTHVSKSTQQPTKTPLLDIYLKDFFDIWDIEAIYGFSGKLPHLSDGLIFTPVRLPYTPGTCHHLLKWKPPHLNTVDFSADMLYDRNRNPRVIMLYVGVKGMRVFKGHFAAPYGDQYKNLMLSAMNNSNTATTRSSSSSSTRSISVRQIIVECYWIPSEPVATFIPIVDNTQPINPNNECPVQFDLDKGYWIKGGWVIERVRTDKSTPNDVRTVDKVMESIEDGITFNDLKDNFSRYKTQGKKTNAEMCLLPSYYYQDRPV